MNNIRIIRTGIDVSKILAQIKAHPEDWGAETKIAGAQSLHDQGFPVLSAGVLQLVVGGVKSEEEFVADTELCIPTPACAHHSEIIKFLGQNFRRGSVGRCGFLSLPVGGHVGSHIDFGKYYETRDRYHLSIQGRYKYTVGDESVIVEPGTLLWFNNKLFHGTENVGDEVRITFVFDVKHHPENL